MATRQQTDLSVDLPFSGRGWQPARLRPVSGPVAQALDLIILGGLYFGVVVLPQYPFGMDPAQSAHADLRHFLELRISLRNLIVAAMCVCSWYVILMTSGVYSPRRTRSLTDYLFRAMIAINSATGVVGFTQVVLHKTAGILNTVMAFWGSALVLMTIERVLLLVVDRFVGPALRPRRDLLIVGSGPRARLVYEELKVNSRWNYHLVGFVDSDPQGGFSPAGPLLGGVEDLEQILMRTVVDEVVIALPMKSQYEVVGNAIAICQMLGVQAQYFTDYFGTAVTKRRSSAGPDSGRVLLEVVTTDYRLMLKRVLDFTLAFLALLVLSPVFFAVAVAVKVTSPGPMLFRQKRYGLNKRTFYMMKFRSMCVDAEAKQASVEHLNETSGPAFKMKKDPRLTPIGEFLRGYSLDELPQLFNVLFGEMSLVGPRPLPLRDVEKFPDAWLMRRFSVKPGVTCLWQILGRSNTDFDRWIALDLEYIDNWSLSLDLLILLRTVPAVLLRRGAH